MAFGTPVVADGIAVVVGSVSHRAGFASFLYGFNASTGQQRWVRTLEDAVGMPVVLGGRVFLAQAENLTSYLLTTGATQWAKRAEVHVDPDGSGAALAARAGRVYARTYTAVPNSGAGGYYYELHAYDAGSGGTLWTYRESPSEAKRLAPAVTDDLVILAYGQSYGSRDPARLLALGADTGRERWQLPLESPAVLSPASVAGRWLLVAADDFKEAHSETDYEYIGHSLRVFSWSPVSSAAASGPSAGVALGLAAATTVAVAALAAWRIEPARMWMARILVLPLFTRLEKDQVLDQRRRGNLYEAIRENPGLSFSDLRRQLELSNGALVHHLRILESQEYVRPVRDGFRTRFYLRGPRLAPEPYLTRLQRDLLDTIHANPGLTAAELAKLLGLSPRSAQYNLGRLADEGKLRWAPQGRQRRYFPMGPPDPAAGLRGG